MDKKNGQLDLPILPSYYFFKNNLKLLPRNEGIKKGFLH